MKREPGHWTVLHTSISSRIEQEAPPFCASSITSLALVLVPPSQVTLQSPHADHSLTLQSTGNVKLLVRYSRVTFCNDIDNDDYIHHIQITRDCVAGSLIVKQYW